MNRDESPVSTRPVLALAGWACACLAAWSAESAIAPVTAARPRTEPSTAPAAISKPLTLSYEDRLRLGRRAFETLRYAEALHQFRAAVEMQPERRLPRRLAGLAAYWARQPDVALEFHEALCKDAPAGSQEEWDLMRERAAMLAALGLSAEARTCAEQLHAARARLAASARAATESLAQAEKGGDAQETARWRAMLAGLRERLEAARFFVRERIFLTGRRVDIKEFFAEDGRLPVLWEFLVSEDAAGRERFARRLSVRGPKAEGQAEQYALVEETAAGLQTHLSWLERPEYEAARQISLRLLLSQPAAAAAPSLPGEEPPRAPPPPAHAPRLPEAETTAPPSVPKTAPDAPKAAPNEPKVQGGAQGKPREFTAGERARLERVVESRTGGSAAAILREVALLAEVEFSVAWFVRVSLEDPAAAQHLAQELTEKHPFAQNDAQAVCKAVMQAAPAEVEEALRAAPRVLDGARSEYARFAMLTALAGREDQALETAAAEFLAASLQSPDVCVRSSAAGLLARGGQRRGLEALFRDLEGAETADAQLLSFALEGVLGPVPEPCPRKDEKAVSAWRSKTLDWWKANAAKLEFLKEAPPGRPCWRAPKE